MGGIDQKVDALRAQVVGKAVRPAKATDPHWHWLAHWCSGAAGKRQCHFEFQPARQMAGEESRLDGAAEYENEHVR